MQHLPNGCAVKAVHHGIPRPHQAPNLCAKPKRHPTAANHPCAACLPSPLQQVLLVSPKELQKWNGPTTLPFKRQEGRNMRAICGKTSHTTTSPGHVQKCAELAVASRRMQRTVQPLQTAEACKHQQHPWGCCNCQKTPRRVPGSATWKFFLCR